MRLINTQTLGLKSFVGAPTPRYGMLSHTWGDDEVTSEQVLLHNKDSGLRWLEKLAALGKGKDLAGMGWDKIKTSCAKAIADGLDCVDVGRYVLHRQQPGFRRPALCHRPRS